MGQDTWNLRHKFNYQGPALRILGLRVALLKSWVLGSQSPRVLGSRVLGSQGSGPQGSGSLVSGCRVSGLRVSGPGSQVLILDYAT